MAPLDRWAPVRLYRNAGVPSVDWCRPHPARFKEPFFDHTVEAWLRHPFNQLFLRRTPIDALGARHEASPGIEPGGFIFHLSRCGSSVAVQALGAVPHTLVLAEADPIHWVLRSARDDAGVTEAQQADWLRWVVSALAQRWAGHESSLVIKFDAWSIVDLPLIRRVFPHVPWVFVYRDPAEVIVSHLRRRGSQVVPSPYGIGQLAITPTAAARMPAEEYCARVLARICEAALAHYDERDALLVEYRQLTDSFWPTMLDHFRLEHSVEVLDRIRQQTRFDAKHPSVRFVDDVAGKTHEATTLVRVMAEEWVMPHYRALESLRAARSVR